MKRPHAPAAGADPISTRCGRRQRGRVLAGKDKQKKKTRFAHNISLITSLAQLSSHGHFDCTPLVCVASRYCNANHRSLSAESALGRG